VKPDVITSAIGDASKARDDVAAIHEGNDIDRML